MKWKNVRMEELNPKKICKNYDMEANWTDAESMEWSRIIVKKDR